MSFQPYLCGLCPKQQDVHIKMTAMTSHLHCFLLSWYSCCIHPDNVYYLKNIMLIFDVISTLYCWKETGRNWTGISVDMWLNKAEHTGLGKILPFTTELSCTYNCSHGLLCHHLQCVNDWNVAKSLGDGEGSVSILANEAFITTVEC